ncbi:hypothetical protein PRZ48_014036 [Zasmidium cellare]|uniref:F-box domain-containing protein n=1 Tax=Zasmidium cellare TaxID=395010 RepID=A0ABR0E090_ZASCE|nr:hypothetical protein PRZ48_014036 [Zasmidium cellare]
MTRVLMKKAQEAAKGGVIAQIEDQTGRRIEIIHNENEAAGKFHEQTQCPLFSMLPQELRLLIFELATAPFDDPDCEFAPTEYYYRLCQTARPRTDTALLLTCRRIWLESNAMPMQLATQHFYFHRGAPGKRDTDWMSRLTKHNRENFGHLEYFVNADGRVSHTVGDIDRITTKAGRLHSFWIGNHDRTQRFHTFRPRTFHVTVRHTDWRGWDSDEPLWLNYDWVQVLLDSYDLRNIETLKLELETLDYKSEQLRPILQRIHAMDSREIESHLVEGRPVKTKFLLTQPDETYTWEGPTNIANKTYPQYSQMDKLRYHVTTVTWTLRFPDIPNANANHLRRAPRIIPPRAERHLFDTYYKDDEYPTLRFLFRQILYADDVAHEKAWRWWRRQIERSKATEDDMRFAFMNIRNKAIGYISRVQALDVEEQRRKAFGGLMAGYLPRKWAAEGSLLRFDEE